MHVLAFVNVGSRHFVFGNASITPVANLSLGCGFFRRRRSASRWQTHEDLEVVCG